MSQEIVIITAAIFGALSIIIGAFGAHALKKILNEDQLKSFETGVKYQMYHTIVLLVIGLNSEEISIIVYWCFTLGVLLFSFSIYGLILSDSAGNKMKFLGPITPIGGLLLLAGWISIIIQYF